MRIVVDLNRCQSYGQCVFAAPTVFRLYGAEALGAARAAQSPAAHTFQIRPSGDYNLRAERGSQEAAPDVRHATTGAE